MEGKNLLELMRDNEFVKVKDLGNGLYACNFTRKAFYRGIWNAMTCKARGLILNDSGGVVARGFEKFFGLDEYNGPTTQEFLDEAVFPLRVSEKANGYLVILSLVRGTVQAFSKSGYTDYSQAAMDMMSGAWDSDQKSALTRYLAHNDVSLLLEVIDPQRDPHIIQYNEKSLVILGAVHNQEEFKMEKLPTDLVDVLRVETDELVVRPPIHLTEVWTRRIAEVVIDYFQRGDSMPWEGVVIQDATGRMVKVKHESYKKVKSYRGSLNRALKGDVDEQAQALITRLGDDLFLEDFLVKGINGGDTLNLPALRPYMNL